MAAQTSSYSAPLVFTGIVLLWLLAYGLLHARGGKSVRRGPAWDCGFGPTNARMQYTAAAFSMPIRRIFAPMWQIDEKIERETDAGGLRVTQLSHRLQVSDRLWTLLYEPIGRWVLIAARRITRIQTGSLRTYLAYSFFTLLILLWLIS